MDFTYIDTLVSIRTSAAKIVSHKRKKCSVQLLNFVAKQRHTLVPSATTPCPLINSGLLKILSMIQLGLPTHTIEIGSTVFASFVSLPLSPSQVTCFTSYTTVPLESNPHLLEQWIKN